MKDLKNTADVSDPVEPVVSLTDGNKAEQYSDINECEYPTCEADEALPVTVLHKGKEVDAWYKNPVMNDCWFEDDHGVAFCGVTKWKLRKAN